MTAPLLPDRQDAVAIIAINDAPYNRMTLDFIDRLEQLVGEIAADDGIRAVVLTGEGLPRKETAGIQSIGLAVDMNPGRLLTPNP